MALHTTSAEAGIVRPEAGRALGEWLRGLLVCAALGCCAWGASPDGQRGQSEDARNLLDEAGAHPPTTRAASVALADAGRRVEAWSVIRTLLRPFESELDAAHVRLLAEAERRNGDPARSANVAEAGLRRWSDDQGLWEELVEATLAREQYALALQRIEKARQAIGPRPGLHYQAARAYFALGRTLGAARERRVHNGRAGQFVSGWLLVEPRGGPDLFLCCPDASALYQVRRALDAGFEQPGAFVLHARIWQRLGRPEVGLAIVRGREAQLLEAADESALRVFSELALDANALDDYLRFERLRAERTPDQRNKILRNACLAVAERFNRRGEPALHLAFVKRALRHEPDDARVMLRLADALWELGLREDASGWYRRVLQQERAHPERARMLERIAP